ncbi:MAG: fimbria major subunit [Bacteroidales bacterium]|nr:fimbria major subunit [Bacteroidales bacterium]
MSRSASHIIHSLAAAIAALLLAACAADRCDWVDADSDEGATYLSLRVFVSGDGDAAATRADGAPEGRLPGNAYENAIDNITIFFAEYNGEAIPANGTEIQFEDDNKLYIDFKSPKYRVYYNEDGSRTVLIRLENTTTFDSGEYSMVVVANLGDLRKDISNIDDLRKKSADYAWISDIDGIQKTGFVMSSFDDAKGGVMSKVIGFPDRDGSKDNPYYGECTLMRLASRIDLCCSQSTGDYGKYTPAADGKDNSVVYEVVNESDVEPSGTVYLLAAEMVNSLSKPSYILRHTYLSSDIDKLTDEQMPLGLTCGGLMEVANKEELNYVIDPNFLEKNQTTTEATLNDFFGSTRPEAIKNDVQTDDVNRFKGNSLIDKFIKGDLSGESYDGKTFDRSLTIGYVNENLFKAGLSADKFATGLCFKAVFVPSVVYKEVPGNDETDEASLAEKKDTDYAYGDDFWHVHVDTDNGEDDVYFSNETAAREYMGAHSGTQVTMTHHPGGVSYYHIWIRHSKVDAEDERHAMYYGIVRNNIYRVLLTFKGPGFNQPFESEIPKDVVWKIYTRGWNLREWNMVEVPDVQL